MASKSKSASGSGGGHHHRHHHQNRHGHHGEGHGNADIAIPMAGLGPASGLDDEELVVDSEWADFDRLLTEYRLRRRINTAPSPLVSRRDLHELIGDSRAGRGKVSQAFYPCPPPAPGTDPDDMDYVQTAMYGRYTKDLGEYAKEEARKLAILEKKRRKEDRLREKEFDKYSGKYRGKCATKVLAVLAFLWRNTFARLGEDWVFLALLGLIVALLSFFMDGGIGMCNRARIWLYRDIATQHIALQYLAWVSLPTFLILFSAGFVHIIAPQSIGSGIPEMKTILRGVALKEYLTFRTLAAKVVGLTATLGSGMPLGKEGPLVHIASIAATLLSKLVTSFQGIYQNESRNTEMLAAACAVGVASCFAAPIGGVLFSIEVTTVYFAVRNYWRGFFAAVCGATAFRLLGVWFNNEVTVTAMFLTSFTMDFPFDPQELIVFSLIGVMCGLGGAGYVWVHRQYVTFMRRNRRMNAFLQKNRFLYPGLVALLVASVTFPKGLGQFMAADINTHDQVAGLFSNFTWTKNDLTVEENAVLRHWKTDTTGVFWSLAGFTIFTFLFSIIASTIPVPSGSFIPVFKIGAALGRTVGELMHLWFPAGVRYGSAQAAIIPGGYATVGAAAFSGAVTHTISVSVIVFEMTGQITHIIPIMIAVLIANAIAALLQPSLYDSIILIKKLPYLPDLLPSSSGIYNVYVEDFMVREVKYIWNGMRYCDLKGVLKDNKNLRSFPLVDKPDSMILLGSIQRLELIKLIDKHIGRERRLQVAARWQREAQERAMEEERRRKEEQQAQQRQRRPSRFEVIPAPDILKIKQQSNTDLRTAHEYSNHKEPHFNPVFGSQPKKSILKKTNSFNLSSFGPLMNSPNLTPYTTVTGAESRIRLAFDAIFRKSTTLQDVNPGDASVNASNGTIPGAGPGDIPLSSTPASPSPYKKVQLPKERVIDMSPEDQKMWEEEEMEVPVALRTVQIDPAPFQLVERTSLLKVHSLFSMLGVNHAYVTATGRLIGVVGLKELRKAIEDTNAGMLPAQPPAGGGSGGEVHEALLSESQQQHRGSDSDDPNHLTLTSMDSALSSNASEPPIPLDHRR
ncbi:chloride channel protein 2 isoform X1 [Frankliniella occidentalis]|uniref:Chloride channel protein 2 isoform X1 n=1 Tax=Frankliniella occidentalis TaxID=133901 RepID=A0A9C6WY31_FRAOC|nr:chloride channel protein 2 isoform X1 [Frankliniella occidentalis]